MLLAYSDDSSERGVFLFATVVVEESGWLTLLDAWTDYRRWLRRDFGLRISKGRGRRVPVELHASHIVTGQGDWRHLNVGFDARMRAYAVGLRLIGKHARVFAVAWVPTRQMSKSFSDLHISPAIDAWRVSLERLATYSVKSVGGQRVLTFVDRGYGDRMTTEVRRMRRYHRVGSMFGGSLPAAAPMFVDDPIERDSKHSIFIQMADLCAYAALREVVPTARVPANLWANLGDGLLREVNMYQRQQPRAIKLIPP